MGRRFPWPFAAAVLLLVLIAVLGTLQYRWLGDVSQAEHDRMRAALQTRVADFAAAFDDEISRTWAAFQVPLKVDTDPAQALADAYRQWQSTTEVPGLVTGVYFVDRAADAGAIAARRLDVERRILTAAELPSTFTAWRQQSAGSAPKNPPLAFALVDPIDPLTPALVVPAPRLRLLDDGHRVVSYAPAPAPIAFIVVTLDRTRLERDLLEPLAARAFGTGAEYAVTIARRDGTPLLSLPAGTHTTAADADIKADLFSVRPGTVARQVAAGKALAFVARERFAVTIVRSGAQRDAALEVANGARGAWEVFVRGRAGSLDALVQRSRRRNLAVAFGVLALLAASFGLILVTAARQRSLARQQIEFVASVSHELRTPLAAICSAGENLADGLVTGTEHVREYGSLIRGEGRKLSQMVDRVMTFAGLASERPLRMQDDVDIARAIGEAVAGVAAEARERGVEVRISVPAPLPATRGDNEALRAALVNVVANGVKYSGRGGRVDVAAGGSAGTLQIAVSDTGIGIDSADLPHVFNPFFRGRRAVASQARGSGIGLSIVRRIVEAHGGRVRIDSRPGAGTTVRIDLPVRPAPVPRPAAAADRVA